MMLVIFAAVVLACAYGGVLNGEPVYDAIPPRVRWHLAWLVLMSWLAGAFSALLAVAALQLFGGAR